jgi:hypothetical protein
MSASTLKLDEFGAMWDDTSHGHTYPEHQRRCSYETQKLLKSVFLVRSEDCR